MQSGACTVRVSVILSLLQGFDTLVFAIPKYEERSVSPRRKLVQTSVCFRASIWSTQSSESSTPPKQRPILKGSVTTLGA